MGARRTRPVRARRHHAPRSAKLCAHAPRRPSAGGARVPLGGSWRQLAAQVRTRPEERAPLPRPPVRITRAPASSKRQQAERGERGGHGQGGRGLAPTRPPALAREQCAPATRRSARLPPCLGGPARVCRVREARPSSAASRPARNHPEGGRLRHSQARARTRVPPGARGDISSVAPPWAGRVRRWPMPPTGWSDPSRTRPPPTESRPPGACAPRRGGNASISLASFRVHPG